MLKCVQQAFGHLQQLTTYIAQESLYKRARLIEEAHVLATPTHYALCYGSNKCMAAS